MSAAIDESKRLEHLDRVVELAKMQHDNHQGFLVISEPLIHEEEESNNILEEKFSGLGFAQLGVGMCSDGLIVNGSLESQLITNIHELSTSLKYCGAQVEKKRSIDSMYLVTTFDVFSGVLEILGEKGLMEKWTTFESMRSYCAGKSEKKLFRNPESQLSACCKTH